jgi:serine phosphatase RsbU (regulator of sigma subunit)
LGEDGTLTIAVGDATGHGLKAGTMVASVKSLFVSLAYHPDISHIFHRMSRVLKEMKLRGLFMAMTMVKVKDYQLSVSIAGMPPILIYRAAEQRVEEVMMKSFATRRNHGLSISSAGIRGVIRRCSRADVRRIAGTI